MSRPKEQSDPQLDDFVDGRLDEGSAAAFQQRLMDDPELQKQVDMDHRVADAIKRQCTPPTFPAQLRDAIHSHAAGTRGSEDGVECASPPLGDRSATAVRTFQLRLLLVLAASVAAVAIGWQLTLLQLEKKGDSRYQQITMSAVYDESVERGFEPLWECPPLRFAMTFSRRQKVPLLLQDLPEGVEMVGLSYLAGLQPTSTCMLARVRGIEVLVWVEQQSRDRQVTPPAKGSNLALYREEKFGLVFYEVSPLPEPALLPHFVVADTLPAEDARWGDRLTSRTVNR